jgi:hypothetical protein
MNILLSPALALGLPALLLTTKSLLPGEKMDLQSSG